MVQIKFQVNLSSKSPAEHVQSFLHSLYLPPCNHFFTPCISCIAFLLPCPLFPFEVFFSLPVACPLHPLNPSCLSPTTSSPFHHWRLDAHSNDYLGEFAECIYLPAYRRWLILFYCSEWNVTVTVLLLVMNSMESVNNRN